MTKGTTQLFNFFKIFLEKNDASEELMKMWAKKKREFSKLAEKVMSKEKSSVKAKKSADAPKGARTGYILFCMKERPKITKEFPDMKNQDIVKLMAQRWAQAKDDDDVMEHFKKLAEEDKERAVKDKKEYVPTEKVEKEKPKKVVRTKTGYLLFCDDERALVKEEGFTGADIMKELGRRWKKLPEEDDDRYSVYMEKAAKLKKAKVEDSDSDSDSEDEEEKPKKKVVKKAAKKIVYDEEDEE